MHCEKKLTVASTLTDQDEVDEDVGSQIADTHADAVVAESDDDPVGPHDESDPRDQW